MILALVLTLTASCKSELDDKPAAIAAQPSDELGAPRKVEFAKKDDASSAPTQKRHIAAADSSRIEWVGSKITGDHQGGFESFTGTASLSERKELESVAFTVDMTSTFSDHERLTPHLKSTDFFDTDRFPESSFESSSILPGVDAEAFGEDRIKHLDPTHTITGELTLKDVTKTVSFPARLVREPAVLRAYTEFTIDRPEFGVWYMGRPDDLIRKEVLLKITLDVPLTGS